MKATKLKSLATTTGPTRLSAGPQATYSCVAHENLKLYGLRRGKHLAHNCETKSEQFERNGSHHLPVCNDSMRHQW